MGDVELVLLIGGAWCAVLGVVVSLMSVASWADGRTEVLLATRATPRRRPRFTERMPERELPGRVRSEAPLTGARSA